MIFKLKNFYSKLSLTQRGLPGGAAVKNLPTSAGAVRDTGLISRLGRSPRAGNGYLLQYSCLENCMDRRAWWATVHGVAKSQTRLTFSFFICLKLSSWYQYSEILVVQLCLTLCDPLNCSPPGSSIHGILQARTLEWIAIPFSRGSS